MVNFKMKFIHNAMDNELPFNDISGIKGTQNSTEEDHGGIIN